MSVPPRTWSINGFYPDCWLRANQASSLTVTQHPVETGASVTDHSYVNQRRFSFDIGASDTLTRAVQGNSLSRSVNTFNYLEGLQRSRTPLTLKTKYGTYSNILIDNIDAGDDFRTTTGLRATVNMVEIIQADTRNQRQSNNPQVTDQTSKGLVPPKTLSKATVDQARKNGLDLSEFERTA